MLIERFEVGVFAENCYLVACEQTRKAIIIDPGDEIERIVARIREVDAEITRVVLTHGHLDHVKEVNAFKQHYDVPVLMHQDDQFLLDALPQQAAAFGLATSGIPQVDEYINEGDTITFGEVSFQVYHTPGHSPGSVSLVSGQHAFVGDVLFRDSIGRTDLPGGNFETLMESIRTKLLPLGDEIKVYPGHGPETTVGRERNANPFLLSLRG